ncbi:MAG: sulfatase-like hydrolase/transferase [Planctomycetaceae bacterium]|nr:sulfatase-like hydrolase/transferase [Planctomycetaceae bacterium]
MNTRTCRQALVFFGFAILSFNGAKAADAFADDSRQPNILFIMTDQQRWDCIGANGNRLIRTPHLDRLAAESANFTHCFVQAPVCVPSRISFFTGRYPHSHRNRVNYTPLDRGEVLMQSRLQEAGYATAAVGKLHYFPPTVMEARRTGFESVELHDAVTSLDRFSDYIAWRKQHDPQSGIQHRTLASDIPVGQNPFRQAIDERYSETTWTGERTRHHLRRLSLSKKPFFLFSSFWKPHSPFEVPQPFDAMYDEIEIPLPKQMTLDEIMKLPPPLRTLILRFRPEYETDRERLQWMYRSYYGAISHVDREVGLILKTLDEAGVADNTIVVFTSDHGDQMLEHGLMGKNCFFESSVRVPFLIRFPGHVRPAQYQELIESVDLLPTLFELIGLPEPYTSQGKSLAGLISPSPRHYVPRTAVFSENVIPEVITGTRESFEFVKGEGIRGTRHPDAKMVRTKRWKYIYYPDGFEELYDLETDPDEMSNLALNDDFREQIYEMKDLLLHWLTTADEADQIAPRWLAPEP